MPKFQHKWFETGLGSNSQRLSKHKYTNCSLKMATDHETPWIFLQCLGLDLHACIPCSRHLSPSEWHGTHQAWHWNAHISNLVELPSKTWENFPWPLWVFLMNLQGDWHLESQGLFLLWHLVPQEYSAHQCLVKLWLQSCKLRMDVDLEYWLQTDCWLLDDLFLLPLWCYPEIEQIRDFGTKNHQPGSANFTIKPLLTSEIFQLTFLTGLHAFQALCS